MYQEISKLSKKLKSKFIFNYDTSDLTWFRTGGEADIFCIVNDEQELEIIINNIKDIPYCVIGAGSNLLIRDGGYKGLIIKLGKEFNKLYLKENKILAGASILDINLSKFAYHNSLKDLEFYSGIPGTIGGAIKMNAGCFGFETKNVVKSIRVIKKNGKKIKYLNNQIDFSYRNSKIEDDIVLSVEFKANIGNQSEIKDKMYNIKNQRENSQPLKTKTSGSTFKNPKGFYAARLIEDSGCKGLKIGDAVVSDKHANFLINLNKAKANEIEDLGKLVIDKVYNKFGINLDWEIQIIGERK